MSADNTNSGGFWIASLTGEENYKSWRIQMCTCLFKLNLTKYIDEPLANIITADAKESDKHKKQDQCALSQMIMRCTPWVLTFIEEIVTAKEAWETLHQTFQASSMSVKFFIKKEFYNTKLGENVDVDQHIHKLHRLSKDLKIARFSIPESEFISIILMSLPSSWDSFISSIDGEDLESSNTGVSKKAAKSILGHFRTKAMCHKSQNSSSS